MPIYKYKAINDNDVKVSGLVEAVSLDAAAEIVQEKGYKILSLEEDSSFAISFDIDFFDRIKVKDIAIFSRQFSIMVSANVSMVQSLKILISQTENEKLKSIISDIAHEVDAGSRLSDAFEKRSKVFSDFYISVIRAGESSGKLDDSLNYLADEMEKDYDMISKIKGAMIYPAFVLSGLAIVGAVMMIFVVPKLTNILAETGAALPLATKILMGTSDFMINYWWIFIVFIIVFIIGIKIFTNTERGRYLVDFLLLKLPIFGKLFQRIYLVRFTRSMHTLLTGGVTITDGLKIAGDVVSNRVYKDLIEETIKEVEDGNSISGVFVQNKEIPKMVSQMMSIGEKTGKLDLVLLKITDFYTREINNVLANLMSLMEPIIMVVMGVAVGLMVAAIILPMYNMTANV